MRRFRCPRCEGRVAFGEAECPTCAAALGYEPAERTIVLVVATGPAGALHVHGPSGAPTWRCLNAAWGCNWIVDPADGTPWCRSYRLTHGRPDTADPSAVAAWADTEVHKRHLLHQLADLGLPIQPRSADHPTGLRFELVHVPGQPAVTGHLEGTITIDLTEADDVRRAELRQQFGEPSRTMLGHLRHEIGHYYWPLLVGGPPVVDEFRRLFGDERTDYGRALEAHHGRSPTSWDPAVHLSAYASAHPAEDWAETFANYLQLTDALETARAHGLDVTERERVVAISFPEAIDRWRRIAGAIDAVAASLGQPALYPYELGDAIVAKLAFVDEQVHRCAAAHRSA